MEEQEPAIHYRYHRYLRGRVLWEPILAGELSNHGGLTERPGDVRGTVHAMIAQLATGAVTVVDRKIAVMAAAVSVVC